MSFLFLAACSGSKATGSPADGDSGPADGDSPDDEQTPYACGWAHGDPGNLQATGAEVGDTIENIPLVDQCGEVLPLWDLAGAWRILFMTAEWCGVCQREARELDAVQAGFIDETGLDFSFVVVLYQDSAGTLPDEETGARYAERVGIENQPVVADLEAAVLDATPYDGQALPGVCALTPEMRILACDRGEHAYERLLDEIREAAR